METTFEFLGGFLDGRRVASDSPDPTEAEQADRFDWLTEGGTPAKRFQAVADDSRLYEVVGRREEGDRARVSVRFIGP
jgi:hypothetical protein